MWLIFPGVKQGKNRMPVDVKMFIAIQICLTMLNAFEGSLNLGRL
jgi:hypothetical protein